MAGTYSKKVLSGGTADGKMIAVASTSRGSGTTIHTVASATAIDEIWLYATNINPGVVNLTIEWGNENNAAHEITQGIPANSGLTLIIPGLILTNSEVVRAYADIASKVLLVGFVNRMTPA